MAGEVLDGKLYGRDSSDMKGGVAAFVAASIALADQLQATPGVVLFITAGEEPAAPGPQLWPAPHLFPELAPWS